ncbi:hypothetical protein ASE03_00510 [Kitasatospora sp. Root187]|nr:hypothetical protein ASC99_24310 [Kitasatospora sp. Root107]KRB77547.1 hypothetical protein ASE03_00510 [Kitasatospora sp. Root187]
MRPIPSAAELLSREVREGREAVVQRALSSLMLGHEPRRWNEADTPTARGRRFVALLDAAAFGEVRPGPVRLVDEFELPSRDGAERAGWPDFALLWDDRILLIELKAEPGSHSPGQCERYLSLARHHHPGRQVDLLYVTPTMAVKALSGAPEGCHYVHTTWAAVLPHIAEAWAGTEARAESELATFLGDYLPRLDRPRAQRASSSPADGNGREAATSPGSSEQVKPPGMPTVLRTLLETAALVQSDRRQRGVDLLDQDPESLEAVRIQGRDLLRTGPVHDGIAITHVQPWIWRAVTSTGEALTESGRATGYELRLSPYRAPVAAAEPSR